jgi:hypothetical protein
MHNVYPHFFLSIVGKAPLTEEEKAVLREKKKAA